MDGARMLRELTDELDLIEMAALGAAVAFPSPWQVIGWDVTDSHCDVVVSANMYDPRAASVGTHVALVQPARMLRVVASIRADLHKPVHCRGRDFCSRGCAYWPCEPLIRAHAAWCSDITVPVVAT